MKYIQKSTPPESLETYKTHEDASFTRLPSEIKKQLKLQLIAEQGGLCCYCDDRITYDTSNIEHFLPKDIALYPELQLEYNNLLSSCLGGQIERQTNRGFPLSCDAKKRNRTIPISPTDPSCESQFIYDEDGNIYGLTKDAQFTIQILNLNNEVIKNRRKAAIDAYIDLDLPSDDDWAGEVSYVLRRDRHGLFMPFCCAVAYYIRHFKMRAAA